MNDRMDPWAAVSHADDTDPWAVLHHAEDAPETKPPAKVAAKPAPHAAPAPRQPAMPPLDLSPVVMAIAELSDDITNALNALTAAIRESRLPPQG